jgi:cobyrinic acid a,c-diamide synthase
MTITRKILVEKIQDYLNHRMTLDELVDWAEQSMMEDDFDEDHFQKIRNIIARIGLADVKAFGLSWDECEEFLNRLGYRTRVEIVEAV